MRNTGRGAAVRAGGRGNGVAEAQGVAAAQAARQVDRISECIEVEIDGVTVRVGRGPRRRRSRRYFVR